VIRLRKVYRSAAYCRASVFRWISEARRGNKEIRNERDPGRPGRYEPHVAVRSILQENLNASLRTIAETLSISLETVRTHMSWRGCTLKSLRWIPRDLPSCRIRCSEGGNGSSPLFNANMYHLLVKHSGVWSNLNESADPVVCRFEAFCLFPGKVWALHMFCQHWFYLHSRFGLVCQDGGCWPIHSLSNDFVTLAHPLEGAPIPL
jgi:hypothetical protein